MRSHCMTGRRLLVVAGATAVAAIVAVVVMAAGRVVAPPDHRSGHRASRRSRLTSRWAHEPSVGAKPRPQKLSRNPVSSVRVWWRALGCRSLSSARRSWHRVDPPPGRSSSSARAIRLSSSRRRSMLPSRVGISGSYMSSSCRMGAGVGFPGDVTMFAACDGRLRTGRCRSRRARRPSTRVRGRRMC